jgi:hypothetical protein
MTLKDCTKEELIWIIKRLARLDDYHLERALVDLEFERVKKKLAEAERWGQVADSCRQSYIDFLNKHEGMKLTDIPINELEEAKRFLSDAQKADKNYDRLMKEVDSYGNR